jgi:replicative DNA helicase
MNAPEAHVPYDLAAEEAVLGSLILDRDAIVELAPILQPSDFYRPANAQVYAAISWLYEHREPADLVILSGELERRGHLEDAGGYTGLMDLVSATPTPAHVVYYARRVRDQATLRRLISAGSKVVEIGFSQPEDVDEALAKADRLLAGVAEQRKRRGFVGMTQVVSEWSDRLDLLQSDPNALVGIPSGFSDLDDVTGGWGRGKLVVVAARPGDGKTAFLLNTARHAAEHGHAVGFFSAEMGREEMMERWVADKASVDSRRLRHGGQLSDAEWSRVIDAQGRLADLPLHIDDTPGIRVSELSAAAHRLHAERGLSLLCVDYLQRIENPRKDGERRHEVGEIARRLKTLARELDIPILAAAQLNREPDRRTSHTPVLADLAESADIEREADIVLMLHHPWRYDPTPDNKWVAHLDFAKHRGGLVGVTVRLRFEGKHTRFQPLSRYTEPR